MRGSTREKIYENEHDAVNDFIERKQAMGGSQTVAPVDEEVNHAIKRYRLVRPDNDSEYLFLSIRGNRV